MDQSRSRSIALGVKDWTRLDFQTLYISTDTSFAELHMELLINTTLKPSDAFVFKYRTQDTLTAEENVPAEYHEYLDIFKEEVECFPESRPWDHATETKPGFEPRVFKLYNLTLEEHKQQELSKINGGMNILPFFLKKNINIGKIFICP